MPSSLDQWALLHATEPGYDWECVRLLEGRPLPLRSVSPTLLSGRTSSAEMCFGVAQPMQIVPMRWPLLATSGAAT